jgi:hypothetical protein
MKLALLISAFCLPLFAQTRFAFDVANPFPATTNRIMLNGVQVGATVPGVTNITITALEPNRRYTLSIFPLYPTNRLERTFSIEKVARLYSGLLSATNVASPWREAAFTSGRSLPKSGSAMFKPKLSNEWEVVTWGRNVTQRTFPIYD